MQAKTKKLIPVMALAFVMVSFNVFPATAASSYYFGAGYPVGKIERGYYSWDFEDATFWAEIAPTTSSDSYVNGKLYNGLYVDYGQISSIAIYYATGADSGYWYRYKLNSVTLVVSMKSCDHPLYTLNSHSIIDSDEQRWTLAENAGSNWDISALAADYSNIQVDVDWTHPPLPPLPTFNLLRFHIRVTLLLTVTLQWRYLSLAWIDVDTYTEDIWRAFDIHVPYDMYDDPV